jgi:prepilin-type N-terminal cleavage/methylation domain-containing protein
LKASRGFTLIEVLIAALILVCGLVAVASVFSFAVRTNAANRQMAVATTLLSAKMEEFRSGSFSDPLWMNASGSEILTVAGEPYIRTWQVDGAVPRRVTVIVYCQTDAQTGRRRELIRAATLRSPRF